MWVKKEKNELPEVGGKKSKAKAKPKKVKQEIDGKLESEE